MRGYNLSGPQRLFFSLGSSLFFHSGPALTFLKSTDFFELVQAKLLMIRLHLKYKQGQLHRSIESAHTPLLSLDPYAANGYGWLHLS